MFIDKIKNKSYSSTYENPKYLETKLHISKKSMGSIRSHNVNKKKNFNERR